MKIFVVSDTHGRTGEFIKEISSMEKPDLIIHLGDYIEDGLKIEENIGIKTIIVKGNGDYLNYGYNEDKIVNINNKKIFLTHGHKYGVEYNLYKLLYKAEEIKADLVLFGHTHSSLLFEEHGIMVMNPGSPSRPRGYDKKKTFGIIEIKEKITSYIYEINSNFY